MVKPGLFDREQQPEEARAMRVSELSRRIGAQLSALGRIKVEGELSGLKRYSSGHVYFDLKEGGENPLAKLACVVWRSQVERALRFEAREGQQVVATGKLDVYAPRGGYSLVVERLEPLGQGELLARLEALKAELRALGWFERKRPLPSMPRVIGVVTSRDGAALRDFLATRSLRWPLYPVRLCHTAVQGPGAAASIAEAIGRLERSGVELICLIRGGGSLEDLWSFNERSVAEAIHQCSVPVVTGVGHETDVTLADLVADLRAHTPTGAAEAVIPDRAELGQRLERAAAHLFDGLEALLAERGRRLEVLAAARVLRNPRWILGERSAALEAVGQRLGFALHSRLERTALRLAHSAARVASREPHLELERRHGRLELAWRRLREGQERGTEQRAARLVLAARTLEAVSPLAVLGRGYAICSGPDGRALRDARQLAPGDLVHTRLARGAFRARIESVAGAETAST